VNVYVEKGVLKSHATKKCVPNVDSWMMTGGPGRQAYVDVLFYDGSTDRYDYMDLTYTVQDNTGQTLMGLSAHEVLEQAPQWVEIETDGTMKEGDIAIQLNLSQMANYANQSQRYEMTAKTLTCNKDGTLERTGQLDLGVRREIADVALATIRNPKAMVEAELETMAKEFGVGLLTLLTKKVSSGTVRMPTSPPPGTVPPTSLRTSWAVPPSTVKDAIKKALDDRIQRAHDDGVNYPDGICPDCKGTGQYEGFQSVEDCKRCNGTGDA